MIETSALRRYSLVDVLNSDWLNDPFVKSVK